jgi:hypothetical protein
MPYVSRDQNGNINGAFANPQPGYATEFLQPTDAGFIKWTLLPYATAKQKSIMNGGISVNLGAVTVEAATDPGSLVLLQGATTVATANSAATFEWVQNTGVTATLTAAQMITLFTAVTTFVQSTFTTLSAVLAAIGAGTITTTAQVDSFASPAWPTNS